MAVTCYNETTSLLVDIFYIFSPSTVFSLLFQVKSQSKNFRVKLAFRHNLIQFNPTRLFFCSHFRFYLVQILRNESASEFDSGFLILGYVRCCVFSFWFVYVEIGCVHRFIFLCPVYGDWDLCVEYDGNEIVSTKAAFTVKSWPLYSFLCSWSCWNDWIL